MQWLDRDLPSRLFEMSFLIKFGFTLFLHDRPADAVRAVTGLARARQQQQTDPLMRLGR